MVLGGGVRRVAGDLREQLGAEEVVADQHGLEDPSVAKGAPGGVVDQMAQMGGAGRRWAQARGRSRTLPPPAVASSTLVRRTHGTSRPVKKLGSWGAAARRGGSPPAAAAGRGTAPQPRRGSAAGAPGCSVGSTGPGPPSAAPVAARTTERPWTRTDSRGRTVVPGVVEQHLGRSGEAPDLEPLIRPVGGATAGVSGRFHERRERAVRRIPSESSSAVAQGRGDGEVAVGQTEGLAGAGREDVPDVGQPLLRGAHGRRRDARGRAVRRWSSRRRTTGSGSDRRTVRRWRRGRAGCGAGCPARAGVRRRSPRGRAPSSAGGTGRLRPRATARWRVPVRRLLQPGVGVLDGAVGRPGHATRAPGRRGRCPRWRRSTWSEDGMRGRKVRSRPAALPV